MKFIFIDTEFTGEHGQTSLVSLGMVTMENQTLEINFNDFKKKQVTGWLKKNVLAKIKDKPAFSKKKLFLKLINF